MFADSPPLRLAHLITSLKLGGAQMHLLKTVSRFRPALISSTVISLVSGGPVARNLRKAGIPVYEMGFRPGKFNLPAIWRLTLLLKTLKPHVVQTYLYHADLLGFLAARRAGVPLVWWNLRQSVMDFSRYRPTTGLAACLCARLSRRVDRILVNSQAGLKAHASLGYDPTKMLVVPNGFEVDRFRPRPETSREVRQELALPAGARLVGMLARFDPQKDHENFLAAAALLQEKHPQVYFLLAGTGITADSAEFQRLMEKYPLDRRRLRLLGERLDTPRLLTALDIYVSSSAFGEGFPTAVGEAMACGVPCVVTDVGDSAFLVGDTGLVVPPWRPRDLSQALEEALLWPEAERASRGNAARARIQQNFDINTMAARLESLYLEAVGKKAA